VAELAEGYLPTRERLAAEIDAYCPPERRREPTASPLLAADLSGLPPALVQTAEYDLLRDDGERYVAALRAAGVAAEHVRWAGHVHGSLGMTRLVASARDWQARGDAFLRGHLS
jgi:acetyl esterase